MKRNVSSEIEAHPEDRGVHIGLLSSPHGHMLLLQNRLGKFSMVACYILIWSGISTGADPDF